MAGSDLESADKKAELENNLAAITDTFGQQ
jgi:hypothetical protein